MNLVRCGDVKRLNSAVPNRVRMTCLATNHPLMLAGDIPPQRHRQIDVERSSGSG